MAPPDAGRGRRLLLAAGAVALGVAELWALNAMAIREVVWGVPTAFDQAFYGLLSFRLHDRIVTRGLVFAVGEYLLMPSPTGVLLPLQGALFGLVFGAGWLQLLNVNFVYFLLLQATTAYAAWHAGGKRVGWAIISVGLILALDTPYFWAGGVMDFRFDFAALCLYGVFVATVVRSRAFLSRPWSVVAAAVAGATVWLRALTLTYFIGVSALFALSLFLRRDANAGARLRNVAWALGALLVATAPMIALQAPAIRAYYWTGHVTGDEPQILARFFGLTSMWKHAAFYPSSLVRSHLGFAFLGAAGALLLLALASRRRDRSRPASTGVPSGAALAFCTLCLAVPLGILTLDVSKSPIVAGITAPAVVWLLLLTAMRWAPSLASEKVVALAVLVWGLGHTSWELTRRIDRAFPREDVRGLVGVYDQIWREASQMDPSQPKGLSVFALNEYLRAEVADFLAYDRHRAFVGLRGEMGQTIFATDLAKSIGEIDRSAFVITRAPRPVEATDFPYTVTLQPLIPALTDYVRARFVPIAEFSLGGTRFELYRRPIGSGTTVAARRSEPGAGRQSAGAGREGRGEAGPTRR